MPQTPLDAFGIVRALDPGIFGTSWTGFRNRYAIMNPHVQGHVVGYKNVKELRDKFMSITYLPTVDLNLPSITDITREFELEPKARKAYDELAETMWTDISAFAQSGYVQPDVVPAVDEFPELFEGLDELDETSTVTPPNVMVRLLRLQQFTGGTVIDDQKQRVRVSHGKAELLDEVLDDVGCIHGSAAGPEPVVVFCRFRSDLDAVREVALKRGLDYKEVSGRRHDGLTVDSEMDPDCDIVGVQIQSGGTGVDLTRARVVIWYSMGYSLSDYDQARKRLHRPGQTRPVVSIHLLASDTADMDVYEALDQRRTVIAGVLAAHDIDPGRLGIEDRTLDPEEVAMMNGKGSVQLPFDRLLAGTSSLGQPGMGRV